MILDIRDFSGLIPRVDAKMLPPNAAQLAGNVKLWNRVLAALRAPLLVATCTKAGPIKSVHRLSYNNVDYWLHWANDVNAVRGPVAGDTWKRLYYTGDGEPRVTRAEMAALKTDTVNGADQYPAGFGEAGASDYPRAFYALGVPAPITAPRLSTSGGAGSTEGRNYVTTNVNVWGEESAPSPPSNTINAFSSATWTTSLLDTAPLNTASVIAASHSSGTVRAYTNGLNWLQRGHRITVASVTGMTDLNGTWTLSDALSVGAIVVSRARTSNVATLILNSVGGLAVGHRVTVSGMGAGAYNGTFTLTGVDNGTNAVTFANAGVDEGTTTDAGKLVMGYFEVALTTAQVYSAGGTWTRIAPWCPVTRRRIYRVQAGSEGQDYRLVAEIAIATTTHADTKDGTLLGYVLPTADPQIVLSSWDTPPGDLIGVVAMPGGWLAGFREGTNVLCMSEPGFPYAWPKRYQRVTDFPIVGLGVWGSNIVACTSGNIHRYTGYLPESIAATRTEQTYPCVSKRSVVSGSEWGVMFASDRGLVLDDMNGPRLATERFYDRKTWEDGVDAGAMVSVEYDGRYHGFWQVDVDTAAAVIFDTRDTHGAISTNTFPITGAWYDQETGVCYVVDEDGVKIWDGDNAQVQVYLWRSKKFVLPLPEKFTAGRIIFDPAYDEEVVAAIEAANALIAAANAALIAAIPVGALEVSPLGGSIGGASMATLSVAGDLLQGLQSVAENTIQFNLYGDGNLLYSTTVENIAPFRIRAGIKTSIVELELIGNANVQSVQIAPSMSELAQK